MNLHFDIWFSLIPCSLPPEMQWLPVSVPIVQWKTPYWRYSLHLAGLWYWMLYQRDRNITRIVFFWKRRRNCSLKDPDFPDGKSWSNLSRTWMTDSWISILNMIQSVVLQYSSNFFHSSVIFSLASSCSFRPLSIGPLSSISLGFAGRPKFQSMSDFRAVWGSGIDSRFWWTFWCNLWVSIWGIFDAMLLFWKISRYVSDPLQKFRDSRRLSIKSLNQCWSRWQWAGSGDFIGSLRMEVNIASNENRKSQILKTEKSFIEGHGPFDLPIDLRRPLWTWMLAGMAFFESFRRYTGNSIGRGIIWNGLLRFTSPNLCCRLGRFQLGWQILVMSSGPKIKRSEVPRSWDTAQITTGKLLPSITSTEDRETQTLQHA